MSANGLTKASHDTLPFLVKPLFTYGLHVPHVDKLCMERKRILSLSLADHLNSC